ncbi:MAG: type IV pilin [Thermoplasmata archaeon]|nr:type IV pilin [Candidatus Sysuiplasma acidicola]
MISNRRKASFRKHKDSGVSEIIGDILILAMTVTLFSTVFVFVNAFPTPNAQTFANFEATLSTPVSINGFPSNTTFLNITHEGGQALTSSLTSVVVQVNQNTSVFSLPSGYVSVNPVSGWSNLRWTTDQTWIMNLTHVTQSSVVGVSIIDKANNYVVWSTVLNGKPSHAYPVLQNAWALPNPVKPGSSITINASIYNGGSGSIALTANVTLLNNSVSITSAKMPMYLNPLSGFYNTSTFTVNKSTPLGQYPVTVTLSGTTGSSAHSHHFSSNYTVMVSVENTGPTIVTASINPNPSTPGSPYTITAYVVDSSPQATISSVTVKPLGPNYMAILNKTTGDTKTAEPMLLSQFQGIYTLSGTVNSSANYTQFETFEINATDSNGNNAIYVVELFLNFLLNPNQYYPSNYLGPTSMTFSGFSWNVSSNSTKFYKGYNVSVYDTEAGRSGGGGIYFHVVMENHNSSEVLHIDWVSNLYFLSNFALSDAKVAATMSFIENSTTYETLPVGSSISLIPNTPMNLTFGYASNTPPPSPGTNGGPFQQQKYTSSGDIPSQNTISFDFILLFGWVYNLNTGTITPYAQTLPFTAIYWY